MTDSDSQPRRRSKRQNAKKMETRTPQTLQTSKSSTRKRKTKTKKSTEPIYRLNSIGKEVESQILTGLYPGSTLNFALVK